ncbi:MAG: hypothetical protein ACKO11_09655 [Cuspidothrix sp.]
MQNQDQIIDVLVVLKPPVNPGEEIKRTGKAIADLSLEYAVAIPSVNFANTYNKFIKTIPLVSYLSHSSPRYTNP